MSAIAAVNKAPKVLPPPSPFGELLRRSRFASYDPDIRQAYTAPPSYIHRGNWGLKRPIANRHRKGHIVLRKFEEHAQYIEWDRADSQVKFINRMEELNITPKLVPNTPWYIGLGQVATSKDSGLDSDFCPGESSVFERYIDERFADGLVSKSASAPAEQSTLEDEGEIMPESTLAPSPPPTPVTPSSSTSRRPTIELDDLGNGGKGAYGAKAPLPKPLPQHADETRVQPNIYAMTPDQFRQYIEKLRELRPEFIKYVREQLRRDRVNNRRVMSDANPDELSDERLFFELGLEAQKKNLHMAFLGRYTEEHMYNPDSDADDPAALANTPQPIRKQPHRFGGLVYASPSELDSYYNTKPQPGIVLQDSIPSAGSYRIVDEYEGGLIASFAGMASHLSRRNAGKDVKPLYEPYTEEGLIAKRVVDPHTGKVSFSTEDSERQMRVTTLHLEETPKTVGATANNMPLGSTRLRSHVVVDNGVDQNFRENPFPPGSKDYNALNPPSRRASTISMTSTTSSYFSGRERLRSNIYDKMFNKGRLPTVKTDQPKVLNEKPQNSVVLNSLSLLLTKNGQIKAEQLSAYGLHRKAINESEGDS